MRPLSVVFVEASAGGVVGGSLTATVDLLRALDRRRFAPVLVRFAPSPLHADLEALGIRARILDRLPPRSEPRSPIRVLRGVERVTSLISTTLPRARALAAVFRAERADIVYAANGIHPNLDAVVAAAWCGLPIVCHHRSFRRVGVAERLASRAVHVAVGVTDEVVAYYRARGVRPGRFVTIPDAVDCERIQRGGGAAVRRELGIPETAPLIGMVGNVQAWKGQHLAVEAAALARRAVPELRCLLVGGVHRTGIAYSEALQRRLAEPDVAGAVRWTGARADVPACMDAMDVVLHASVRPEPFGRVLLEAMAVGKPVIAPREGGPVEIVAHGQTGVLVAPRDAAALADAVVSLLGDPERRAAMGSAARARARTLFDLRTHATAVERVLTLVSSAKRADGNAAVENPRAAGHGRE
jgi:glycosyltransferase involved in cell wall biosynthesis